MLDTDTKRRIDNCRDILVSKVPDPKSQVEQITIALIYKFMDDMDAEAEELGGKRKFFAGTYGKYGWSKLMASNMGGVDILMLYSEAIQKMNENPGIPPLFRDIFKNAYLPYRDPETLRSFLKEINTFSYDHSEKLGDAFEYLLSVLGSQGDAGQFRTPRHIIEFIVDIIDPKKNETILDPACGTAGFLISAYKHILDAAKKSTPLTPEEKKRLTTNIHGYDISPDMVRLSLVNLYLHGFPNPRIEEYDTLTSEDKWNEYADIILANPPFMSPKGGIKPHKRFSVQASRSEVLFVDYIAEHLTPTGRAGIIVPEGIIFQSGTAYKQLREMLVKNSLIAVISLPAGVFNPYSGVKTSILVLDKRLAKNRDSIFFVKIENDGFGLGAQRRAIEKSELPETIKIIKEWVNHETSAYDELRRDKPERKNILVVPKEKLATNGDYNLSGERYREIIIAHTQWPLVPISEICEFRSGLWKGEKEPVRVVKILRNTNFTKTGFLNLEDIAEHPVEIKQLESRLLKYGDIILEKSGGSPIQPVGRVALFNIPYGEYSYSNFTSRIRVIDERANSFFVWLILNQFYQTGKTEGLQKQTSGIRNLDNAAYQQLQIPLPPLEIQKGIVAEIEGYQKIIDGARTVLDNYRPHIPIHPDWPISTFEAAPFQIIDGDRGTNYPSKEDFSPAGYCLFLNTKNVRSDGFKFDELEFISAEKDHALRKGKLERGDVLLTTRGPIGNTALYDESVEFNHIRINSGMLIFRPDSANLSSSYLFHFFQSENFRTQREAIVSGAAQPQLPIRILNDAKIPLPPLATQQDIVAEIKAEQALVAANRELIARFEKKIQSTLANIWVVEGST
ncbi:MAG: N-6 DNA methylase [Victivallales bacterium]|jgi:type I restriction enzyme M protein